MDQIIYWRLKQMTYKCNIEHEPEGHRHGFCTKSRSVKQYTQISWKSFKLSWRYGMNTKARLKSFTLMHELDLELAGSEMGSAHRLDEVNIWQKFHDNHLSRLWDMEQTRFGTDRYPVQKQYISPVYRERHNYPWQWQDNEHPDYNKINYRSISTLRFLSSELKFNQA